MLEASFAHDGLDPRAVNSDLVRAALDRQTTTTVVQVGLAVPLVGLGGPAATYYPAVAAQLGVEAIIPVHADVANAIGAVVGRVRISREITVSAPRRGLFRVHVGDEPPTFYDLDEAVEFATRRASELLAADMVTAGAGSDYETSTEWHERSAEVEDRSLFVEGTLSMTTTGRPDLS